MTDIVERLRRIAARSGDRLDAEAADEIERLRAALRRLLNDSMYKDHPEASQMAIDALNGKP
jgi:ketopantoate reductase